MQERKDIEQKTICLRHLKHVFFADKHAHTTKSVTKNLQQCSNFVKNDQYREKKEMAQAKLENAICIVVGESVYTKHEFCFAFMN